MSESNSPVSAMFDFQRTAIEQTHEAIVRSVEAQQEFGHALADLSSAKRANEHGYEAVRTAVDIYVDAIESTTPGQQDLTGDFRAVFDEQLDTLEANQVEAIETFEANVQDGSEAVDELFEEFLAALDEQFETVLDAHTDVEDRTVEAFEGYEGNIDEFRSEFESQFGQFEEQVDALQQQIEDVNGNVVEIAEQQAAAQAEAVDTSLETINGLGSTYADRLQKQGIESFESLAEANVEAVAQAADVSHEQATEWVEAAQPKPQA